MLGKSVGDLQSDVTISEGVISGTLNYVTGYTDFSGDVSEQSGNYLVLKCTSEKTSDVITVELIGGTVGHPVTLDADRNIVIRITNTTTQSIKVVGYNEWGSVTKTFALTGLTLAAS